MQNVKHILLIILFSLSGKTLAEEKINAYEIIYEEKETGTDFYDVTYTVTEHFIRVDTNDSVSEEDDEHTDSSGYIVYDIKQQKIFSVGHYDESILVIPKYPYKKLSDEIKQLISYQPLKDAPTISGKPIFSYRVDAKTEDGLKTCMDIQLASGLLTEVSGKLQQYQSVIAGQQIKNLFTVPEEYKTPCYLIAQVHNNGQYYEKGLPVHENYGNNKIKLLKSFKEVKISSKIFNLPKSYRQYKLEEAFH